MDGGDTVSVFRYKPKDEKAEARLLNAAPELLEACEAALFYLPDRASRDTVTGRILLRLRNKLQRAIAKARTP